MRSELRLRTRDETPPGGYYFKDPSGKEYRHITFNGLVEQVKSVYRLMGATVPENFVEMVDASCAEYCFFQGHAHFVEQVIPSVFQQHDRVYRIDDSKLLPDCPHNYNPGLIEKDGHIWMVYRRHEEQGRSLAVAVKLDGNLQPIASTNRIINLPKYHDDQTDEDPRVWWFNEEMWISWTSWKRNDWTYLPVMRMAKLNDNWEVVSHYTPTFGNNGASIQKNWSFFQHEGDLHMIYGANPHQVVKFDWVQGEPVGSLISNIPSGVNWQYGIVRGGTPPILIGNEYLTFMHSRLGQLKNGRYYMGAYYFEARAPFKPTRCTPMPLLAGSDEDELWNNRVLVAFPDGCVRRGNELIVSIGVNDKFSAIYVTDIDELNAKMKTI